MTTSNSISVNDAYTKASTPEQQFQAARNIEQSIIQQKDIAQQTAAGAAQQVAQQTAEVQNEQLRQQNAVKMKAVEYAAKIGPEQLMGHLAQVQAESTEHALQLRTQYDKLDALSFFSSPVDYLLAQPQKDQIAEQVNSTEGTAKFAQESISTINKLKSEHVKTAMETADVLSADALRKQEEINMATAKQRMAEASAKLGTERLQDLHLLQNGAVQQIQINNQKAAEVRANTELAMNKEKFDEWKKETPLREADRKNRTAQIEMEMERLAWQKEKWPLEKKAAELKYTTEEEKQHNITVEDAALDAGTKLLGLPPTASPKFAKDTYNKAAYQVIKDIGFRSAQLSAATGSEQAWYGDNAGEVFKNLSITGASFHGKPQQKVYDFLKQLYFKASDELKTLPTAGSMSAIDKEAYKFQYISTHAAQTIKALNNNAEDKTVRLLFGETTIGAVYNSNQQLASDPVAKMIFEPMINSDVGDQKPDHDLVMGRLSALLTEKKINYDQAIVLGSAFYNTLAAHNNTLLQFSSFGAGYQEGYNVNIGPDKLDLTNPAQFSAALTRYQMIQRNKAFGGVDNFLRN